MRKELKIGLLLFAMAVLLSVLNAVPHFVLGLLFSLAICLEIIGGVSGERYQKIRTWKRSLLK